MYTYLIKNTRYPLVLVLCLLLVFTASTRGQQTDVVDFLKIDAQINPVLVEGKIFGELRCTFKILRNTDSIYLNAIKMTILESALEGVPVRASEDKIWMVDSFETGREYTAFFHYEASPKQTLYFTGDQIWTQGQGKYTSHWLPSVDDMNDKIEFDLNIISKGGQMVIANGVLEKINESPLFLNWSFDMQKPMSSYLVAFALGDFDRLELQSDSGVPIELYYRPEDSLKAEPTYRYSKEIFDFLETEIGVTYPWQNYKQVPVRDFLYAGMENTTTTIFSEAFVVDSIGFNDRNYVNVNAHELAHQWFGNLVTETEGTHHWLHEGFATYYALLTEKEIFGDDYYYWKLLQSAEQLEALSQEGKGQSLLDPKASSLIFYEKGAWALHLLKELIGEEAFKVAVKNYLTKHEFANVTTTDFLNEVKAASPVDISQWEADWLRQTAFKAEQAYEFLKKSDFIKGYFEVSALRAVPFEDKKAELLNILRFPNDYTGQEAVYQLAGEPISETIEHYKMAFESDNRYIRQAIALSIQGVPIELQPEYESLLDDDSYVTKEAALYNLWASFPDKRQDYLNKMERVVGFQDKNVRQLWLTLAIFTKGYRDYEKGVYYAPEWHQYTSSDYSFEIRQLAFTYINQASLWITVSKKNLVNASFHHNWRFRNFARKMLKNLVADERHNRVYRTMLSSFSEEERKYLESILKTE